MEEYNTIRSYLESFIPPIGKRYPKELGLVRMKKILELLGNPHLQYKTIHVAGTSGKGSTATILSRILSTAGYKTGLTISPHLQLINERIQINGEMISLSNLILMVRAIEPVIKSIEKSALGKPTYFEILLAIAFNYFAKEKVDIAVVETGLGGTWDGTNVVNPVLAILTNVGLDHTEILGPTVEDIAKDKAGIIKEGVDVISGVEQDSVVQIVSEKIKLTNSQFYLLYKDFSYATNSISSQGCTFDFQFGEKKFENLQLSLLGKHQIKNASLGIVASLLLKKHGFTIEEKHIRSALETVVFPGRMEVIQQFPRVVLDGAHNSDKIKTVIDTLPLFQKKRPRWIAVVAIKKDKQAKEILNEILPNVKQLIVTEFTVTTDLGSEMAIPAKELYKIAISLRSRKVKARGKTFPIKNPKEAIQAALDSAGSTGSIIVTGSLYLVGEVREIWKPREKILR